MKNKLTVFLSLSLILFLTIGCSLGGLIGGSDSEESSSKSEETSTTSEKKKEAEPSGEVVKVGIPECDELATYINDNSEAIEGNVIAKAAVYYYKNYVLESIRENIKNMSDKEKEKTANTCNDTLKNLKENLNK